MRASVGLRTAPELPDGTGRATLGNLDDDSDLLVLEHQVSIPPSRQQTFDEIRGARGHTGIQRGGRGAQAVVAAGRIANEDKVPVVVCGVLAELVRRTGHLRELTRFVYTLILGLDRADDLVVLRELLDAGNLHLGGVARGREAARRLRIDLDDHPLALLSQVARGYRREDQALCALDEVPVLLSRGPVEVSTHAGRVDLRLERRDVIEIVARELELARHTRLFGGPGYRRGRDQEAKGHQNESSIPHARSFSTGRGGGVNLRSPDQIPGS